MSIVFFLASGSCPTNSCIGMMLFWEAFGPSLDLVECSGFNGKCCCDKPCLDSTLQAVLSALSSGPL